MSPTIPLSSVAALGYGCCGGGVVGSTDMDQLLNRLDRNQPRPMATAIVVNGFF
jgi:hypothetical protein